MLHQHILDAFLERSERVCPLMGQLPVLRQAEGKLRHQSVRVSEAWKRVEKASCLLVKRANLNLTFLILGTFHLHSGTLHYRFLKQYLCRRFMSSVKKNTWNRYFDMLIYHILASNKLNVYFLGSFFFFAILMRTLSYSKFSTEVNYGPICMVWHDLFDNVKRKQVWINLQLQKKKDFRVQNSHLLCNFFST